MPKAYIDESSLTSIGDAIRSVNGSSSLYTPSQMANEILALTSGSLTYKGTVSSQSQLPSDPSNGDLYIVGNQTMFWSDTDNEWKTISVHPAGVISTVKVNGTPLVEDSQGAVDVVIPSWSMQQSKPSYTASEVGAVATSSVGAASGVASLGSDGKVPSSQLPEIPSNADWSVTDSTQDGYIANKPFQSVSTSQFTRYSGVLGINVGALLERYGGLSSLNDEISVAVDGSSIVIDQDGLLKATGIAPETVPPLQIDQDGKLELDMEDFLGRGLTFTNDTIEVYPYAFIDTNMLDVNSDGEIYVRTLGLVDGTTMDTDNDGKLIVKIDDVTIKSDGVGIHVDTEALCDGYTISRYSEGGELYVQLSGGLEASEYGIAVKTSDLYSSYEGGLGIDQNTNCLYVREDMFLPDSTVANVEEDMASRAYSIGEYLMCGGELKRVTSAISSGDLIVDGTNVTTTTIMEEIVRLTQ